jgi:hypothetical protein
MAQVEGSGTEAMGGGPLGPSGNSMTSVDGTVFDTVRAAVASSWKTGPTGLKLP